MKREAKTTEEDILVPHPLLHLPGIASGILIRVHEKPEHYDKLKETACDLLNDHCNRNMEAIKSFKKKDGFDFPKEYKKWLKELKTLFAEFLDQDYPRDVWEEKGAQINAEHDKSMKELEVPLTYHDIPLVEDATNLFKEEWKQHMQNLRNVFDPDRCLRHFERLSVEQVELHKKAAKVYGLPPEWTYTTGIGVLEAQVLPPRKRRKTWEEVKLDAEDYVRKHGYSGFGRLWAVMGCSPGTLRRAIKTSPYLTIVKELYDAKPHRQCDAEPSELNVVRQPRPPKKLTDKDRDRQLANLNKDIDRIEDPAKAKEWRRVVDEWDDKEALALFYKDRVRRLVSENKRRQAKGQKPLQSSILVDFEKSATHTSIEKDNLKDNLSDDTVHF